MKNPLQSFLFFTCMLLALPVHSGWNPLAQEKDADQPGNDAKVREAIAAFKNRDPSMQVFFDRAHGYAVFPTVGKGGMGIGGAYGKGRVFRQGSSIGSVSLTQVTIGFQLGGQAYREIIFFRDKATLDDFISGNFEFSARASAVAATAGASADADYNDGVAVFTLARGGLMYEASIGGQKFKFTPTE